MIPGISHIHRIVLSKVHPCSSGFVTTTNQERRKAGKQRPPQVLFLISRLPDGIPASVANQPDKHGALIDHPREAKPIRGWKSLSNLSALPEKQMAKRGCSGPSWPWRTASGSSFCVIPPGLTQKRLHCYVCGRNRSLEIPGIQYQPPVIARKECKDCTPGNRHAFSGRKRP